jgi:hypothetical protein
MGFNPGKAAENPVEEAKRIRMTPYKTKSIEILITSIIS